MIATQPAYLPRVHRPPCPRCNGPTHDATRCRWAQAMTAKEFARWRETGSGPGQPAAPAS